MPPEELEDVETTAVIPETPPVEAAPSGDPPATVSDEAPPVEAEPAPEQSSPLDAPPPSGEPRESSDPIVRGAHLDRLVDAYEDALLGRPFQPGTTVGQKAVLQSVTRGESELATARLLEIAREWLVNSPGDHDTELLDALTNAAGATCLPIVHQLAERLVAVGARERRAIDSDVLGDVLQGDELNHLRAHSIGDAVLPWVLGCLVEIREVVIRV